MNLMVTGFAGTNNQQDKRRLKGPVVSSDGAQVPAECRKIVNCDISDKLSAILRPGKKLVYPGTPHSLWDRQGREAFFVEGSFKRLLSGYPNYSSISLHALTAPSLPMSYAEVNYLVACSNGIDLFLIENGVASDFIFPSQTFKEKVMSGHILAYFKRQLYIAVDNALYAGDPENIEVLDERDPPFVFNSRIRMVLPLLNGMYVAADKVYWLSGRGSDELTIQADHDLVAVEGTGVSFDGGLIGTPGNVGFFTAQQGICIGLESGEVTNLTLNTVGFTAGQRGAALIRQSEGLNQYISWV